MTKKLENNLTMYIDSSSIISVNKEENDNIEFQLTRPRTAAARQYFDRAAWALSIAADDAFPPNIRSHMTAMTVHACQSLNEALSQVAEEEMKTNVEFKATTKRLPHAQLIENIRNLDLHGKPLPICPIKGSISEVASKPGRPIKLASSDGVDIWLEIPVGPEAPSNVERSRKDLKNAKFTLGPTVSWGCQNGKFFVHDINRKAYLLLHVLAEFLTQCDALLKGLPSTNLDQPAEKPSSDP